MTDAQCRVAIEAMRFAAATKGCVIPLLRSNTIWMR